MPRVDRDQLEQNAFLAALRTGKVINNGDQAGPLTVHVLPGKMFASAHRLTAAESRVAALASFVKSQNHAGDMEELLSSNTTVRQDFATGNRTIVGPTHNVDMADVSSLT